MSDPAPQLGLDAVGIFYMAFGCSWTAVLIAGMTYLWTKRHMPLLRIRGLPLSFAAIIFLHLYWMAVQFGYVYGPFMSAGVEFWIMGIWLPFGVALFHASNTRFLYVARAQRRFVEKAPESDRATIRPRPETLLGKYRAMDHTRRVLLLVGTGMLFQFLLTLVMFLVSRKFHPSFGIPGTEVTGTPAEQRAEAGRGWEWWPSVFWQFFWAWLVAPFILWKARKLNDTQGWRTQTIACCIANLHATPMWLVGLYIPEMATVNRYWIPPQWIAVSIMLIEIFTIFIPCWEVMKHRNLCQETLESIAHWESRQRTGAENGIKSLHSSSTVSSWLSRMSGRTSSTKTSSSSGSSVLTMDALELTLARNPEPLQTFSALKDFSGENIAFLMRVREWKVKYLAEGRDTKYSQKEAPARVLSRECFESAVRIYHDFVSARGAEFQINLSSTDFRKLENIFEAAASAMYRDHPDIDPVTPFNTQPQGLPRCHNGSDVAILEDAGSRDMIELASQASQFGVDVPEGFDETVFDDAEGSIKYLVLTNTWPKFIKERRSIDSMERLASGI
ncbi:hypothetical protein S40285_02848 [Stachybotrys chlorohalonatus IBT 40285]|uniref:RGS domain-containing protein n=1 Tax=Stachybotrys chlorohalonatus (strain IBT 40285) TaxID=1283841 RepID=A0A084QLN6_STAC4|nr:hypothetical protein S40285_02848 [Stachybotrys chlorohalonata IBT 40285]